MLIKTHKDEDCLYYFLKATNIFFIKKLFKKWTLPELNKKIRNESGKNGLLEISEATIKRFLNKLIYYEILHHNGYRINSDPVRLFEFKRSKLESEWKKSSAFKITKELSTVLD